MAGYLGMRCTSGLLTALAAPCLTCLHSCLEHHEWLLGLDIDNIDPIDSEEFEEYSPDEAALTYRARPLELYM